MWASARARVLGTALAIGLSLGACSPAEPGTPAVAHLPSSIPEDFPLPPGAEFEGGGDDFTIRVPGFTVPETMAFYHRELPKADWQIEDHWQGEDPRGLPTSGMVIEHGEHLGAIALTGHDDEVVVRINLRQPTVRETETGERDEHQHEHQDG